MQCHCTDTVGGRDSPKTQFVWRLKLTTLPQTHWLGWGKSLPIHRAIVPFGRGVTADALCTSIPSHFFYSFRRLWIQRIRFPIHLSQEQCLPCIPFSKYLAKVTIVPYDTCIWRPRLGRPHWNFKWSLARKLKSPSCGGVCLMVGLPYMFVVLFDWTPIVVTET